MGTFFFFFCVNWLCLLLTKKTSFAGTWELFFSVDWHCLLLMKKTSFVGIWELFFSVNWYLQLMKKSFFLGEFAVLFFISFFVGTPVINTSSCMLPSCWFYTSYGLVFKMLLMQSGLSEYIHTWHRSVSNWISATTTVLFMDFWWTKLSLFGSSLKVLSRPLIAQIQFFIFEVEKCSRFLWNSFFLKLP